jgi:hypothetical protein
MFDYDRHLRDAAEARSRYESIEIIDADDYRLACQRLDEIRHCRPGTWEFLEAGALEDAMSEWERHKAD